MAGCVQTSSVQTEPLERVSMGASMGVHDVSCTRIRESIPQQLSKLYIPYEWLDQDESMLSVGPFVEDIGFASTYSRIRQIYFLKITCSDELTTSISGDAIFEGLNTTGQWIGITDTTTIEHYSMQFLQNIDL